MDFAKLFDQDDGTRSFAAGEAIIEEGHTAKEVLVLLEGDAEIIVGGQVVLNVGRGDLVGEMSMVDHTPASATVRAASHVKAAVVDEKRFLFLVQQHPTFAIEVMRVMADRLRKMDARQT